MKNYFATLMFVLVCQSAYGELEGDWPAGGGNITIRPTAGPIQTSGLEFVAEPGVLTQGASAAPFAFFLPNSGRPGNVALGSLGTPVTIDGLLELDVSVSASANYWDVTATWGKGVEPTAFPMCGLCPEPASVLLAAVGFIGLLGLRTRRNQG